jgi:hypothetical protein
MMQSARHGMNFEWQVLASLCSQKMEPLIALCFLPFACSGKVSCTMCRVGESVTNCATVLLCHCALLLFSTPLLSYYWKHMFWNICFEAVALFLMLHKMNYKLTNFIEWSSSAEAGLFNSSGCSMHFIDPRVPLLYSHALPTGPYPQPYQSIPSHPVTDFNQGEEKFGQVCRIGWMEEWLGWCVICWVVG